MKIKVSEVSDIVLDWMVAKCEGVDTASFINMHQCEHFHFSTDWSEGGPIIKRERIGLDSPLNQLTMFWVASMRVGNHKAWDHDPLIAALRCYVMSKMGVEVDVPDDLTRSKL